MLLPFARTTREIISRADAVFIRFNKIAVSDILIKRRSRAIAETSPVIIGVDHSRIVRIQRGDTGVDDISAIRLGQQKTHAVQFQ